MGVGSTPPLVEGVDTKYLRTRRVNSTHDIDKYAYFIVTAISTTVDKAIPTTKSGRLESQPVSDETLALIKEKRRLFRWQYFQAYDSLVKKRISQ